MGLHYLQHVPFEDLANIKVWAEGKGHSISKTLLFNDEQFPEVGDFDWLVIMGGPMNIYEEKKYPSQIFNRKHQPANSELWQ